MKNSIPEWYSLFSVYIDFYNEILDEINRINYLTFEKRYEQPFIMVKPVIDISVLISRIIPFRICEFEKIAKIVDNENIDYFTEFLPFVGKEIRQISKKYNNVLFQLGSLRNKYEHKPHFINYKYIGGTDDASDIVFKIPKKYKKEFYIIVIATDEVESLIVDIGNIILEISKYILNDIEQNYIKYIDYPYTINLKNIEIRIKKYLFEFNEKFKI